MKKTLFIITLFIGFRTVNAQVDNDLQNHLDAGINKLMAEQRKLDKERVKKEELIRKKESDKNDHIYFVSNQPRETLSEITREFSSKGLKSFTSNCNVNYDEKTHILKNEEHCFSYLNLEDFPADYSSDNAYEFELNFSLTPEFQQIEEINNKGGWPFQVMLGATSNEYTWLGVTPKGKLYIGYMKNGKFTELLTVFNSDRVYMDKPNHLKFVWLPNGYYYIELNSYKRWSFDLKNENSQIIPPVVGLSNRIVFYSNIKVDSMFLNVFKK